MKKCTIILGLCSVLLCSCQDITTLSGIEEVTIVAEPQISEEDKMEFQEAMLETDTSDYGTENSIDTQETEIDENNTKSGEVFSQIDEVKGFDENQIAVDSDNLETEVGIESEETIPYGMTDTLNGFQTVDGVSIPVTVTIGIKDVIRGKTAYSELLEKNAMLQAPEKGKEYIIITIYMEYNAGEVEEISLQENIASLKAFAFYFELPEERENAEDVTGCLENSLYNYSLKVGESITGKIAFLHNETENGPLVFVGYGNTVELSLID
ncbi:MAG TPA: hypothetical protein H9761_05705 [Candidatus Eisenbergiella merdavium]|uniref:DUF4352 domain-containing protein n=1 Tax=Candidatus Eisenbergiella merdavium TaxID=2838551 RepID=A0A9D2NEZ5_9FIRM|nr:hypothetical protein [Candidatus Eisenbergiella merdavium]